MRRLGLPDRVLFVAGLALFAFAFGAQLYGAFGGGAWYTAVRARGAGAPDAYPVVYAVAPTGEALTREVEPGDELLRVGSFDARGATALRTQLHVLSEHDGSGALQLRVRRDGVEREVSMRMARLFRWDRALVALGFAVAGALAFLGGGSAAAPRLFFLTCAAYGTSLCWFDGGSLARTVTAMVFTTSALAISGPCALYTLQRFPEAPARIARLHQVWPLLFVAIAALWSARVHGWPAVENALPGLMVLNIAFCLALVSLLVAGHRRSGPRGRRQLRWVALGIAATAQVFVAVGLLVLFRPEWERLGLVTDVSLALVPAGFLVALVRDNAFDVDRLIVATATWGAAFGLLLLAVVGVAPLLSAPLAAATGLPPEASQAAVALGCGLAIGPLARRLRPLVEGWFFPARRRFAAEAALLGREIGETLDAAETAAVLGARLVELLGAEHCRVWAVQGGTLELRFESHPRRASGEGASAMELLAFASAGAVVCFEEGGAGTVPAEDRAAGRKAGLAVLVPVQRGDELALLVALGVKGSGDVYTRAELSQLQALAERAGIALLRGRNAELRRAGAEARAANVAKSRFLAAASHDLRQPLHALGLFVEALGDRIAREGRGQDELGALAARAGRSAESLRALFDGVLDVSKLDAGAVEPRPQAFRLGELFDVLRDELAPQALSRGLLLRVVPTAAVVRSDPLLLGRMLRNLLVNAVHYTERGAVVLCARRRGAGVALEVRDSGPGLAAEDQLAIFEEFHRLAAGRSSGEGLGLGLSIVQRLAALLGHPVALRSAPGRGSVFSVTVPRAPASEASAIARETAAGDDPLEGSLYVVVDDDPAIREALRALLEGWGCRVLGASGTAELRAVLADLPAPPAALILDYRLAGDDTGVAALAVARGLLGEGALAVLVTGETTPEALAELRALGLPVLTKPVAPMRLRAVLASLAARRGA